MISFNGVISGTKMIDVYVSEYVRDLVTLGGASRQRPWPEWAGPDEMRCLFVLFSPHITGIK